MGAFEPLLKEVIARKFALGQMLDIEVQDVGKIRFQGPLLGMKEGRYLITDLPSITKHGDLRDRLQDNQELIVRTICERTTGEALGFRSHVVARMRAPDQLLFIAFPPTVQVHELRNEKRVLVFQPARLMQEPGIDPVAGTLVDLSSGGCRVELTGPDQQLYKRDDCVYVDFEHPEDGRAMQVKAHIKSVRGIGNVVSIGMAFAK
ncbi:MAG TPA: flagellar brake protein [Candidatus Acidoferrum sp.]|nr:flagellar brake protein [Candidatus Acidoferrum sp.]